MVRLEDYDTVTLEQIRQMLRCNRELSQLFTTHMPGEVWSTGRASCAMKEEVEAAGLHRGRYRERQRT